MRSQFFTTELNLNTGNKLVSVSTAIIFALLFSMANELFYWDLEGVEFFVVCLTCCLCGYVFAELVPAAARALPLVISICVVGGIVFSVAYQKIQEREVAEKSQAFFEKTNYCEGYALVNKRHWPACVDLKSETIRNWCSHIEGNVYQCQLLNTGDIVSRPKWVLEKNNSATGEFGTTP